MVRFASDGTDGLIGRGRSGSKCPTFAYIANTNDNTVSVIDTATNTVIDTVPVGDFPLGVAATPDGDSVYVTNQGDATVSVIATATHTVTDTVPVVSSPLAWR